MSLCPGTKLGKWILGNKVGEGACGQVFEVHQPGFENLGNLVIKCILLGSGKGKAAEQQTKIANTLYYEHTLLRGALLGYKFSPALPMGAYGQDLVYRYLVMERCDMDLRSFAKKSASAPSLRSIATIGLRLLEALKSLHERGYVFVDVKPDNFMIIKSNKKNHAVSDEFEDADRLVVVDYGLVEKYIQCMGGGHREDLRRADMAGTPSYASLAVIRCCTPARRDDLEALGYVLLSLMSGGDLPWSSAKSHKQCVEEKISCDIDDLASSLGCPELAQIILLSRDLAYDAKPAYDKYAAILQSMKMKPAQNESTKSTKTTSKSRKNAIEERLPAAGSSQSAKVARTGRNSDVFSSPEKQEMVVEETEMVIEKNPRSGRSTSSSSGNSDKQVKADGPLPMHQRKRRGLTAAAAAIAAASVDESLVASEPTSTGAETRRGPVRGSGVGAAVGGSSKALASKEVVINLVDESEDDDDVADPSHYMVQSGTKNSSPEKIPPVQGKGRKVKASVESTATPLTKSVYVAGPFSGGETPVYVPTEITEHVTSTRSSTVVSKAGCSASKKGVAQKASPIVEQDDQDSSFDSSVTVNTRTRSRRSKTPPLDTRPGAADLAAVLQVQLVLEARSGPHKGAVFPVGTGRIASGKGARKGAECMVLGRCADVCDLALPGDPFISERHLEFQLHSDESGTLGLLLRDGGSTNGSKLDGRKLPVDSWVRASIGSEFSVGQTALRLTVRVHSSAENV